ncbi:AI-2E family transporter [Bauldia sp.]|uniref:AI-2E family transporter n=1 Tax=Bauldia sp. TaxID=2575872 RepID=UPI003BAB1A05
MSEIQGASGNPDAVPADGTPLLTVGNAFSIAGLMLIVVLALIFGSGILVPLAVALLFWFFLNALARMYERLWRNRFGPLRPLSLTLAFLTLLAASLIVTDIIVVNVGEISSRTEDFEKSLNILVDKVAELTGVSNDEVVNTALSHLSIDQLLSALLSGLTGLASNIGVVFLFVIFLLVEQRYFGAKLRAVVPGDARRRRIEAILERIGHDVQSYLWTMFVVSMMTAVLSYGVMVLVGLDSPAFWAFLIFVLNFIPTIGSILATGIPALYSLLQFGEFGPFVILLVTIGIIQFVIGNIIQPRMAAQTLNLSQFVVVLSLFVWGAIWGVGGLFLAVPLTAVAMIICANFPQTRPLAILMSEAGTAEPVDSASPSPSSDAGK